ncbi:MAG: hypothetical protein RL518_1335 [Pseudomonadota bacterium]
MTDPNQLVLHKDAQIQPIDTISKSYRKRLSGSGSYVLSRIGARNGSIVIDEQGAKLVSLLAEGHLLTDALRRLAEDAVVSPEVVAREAYPLIKALIDQKYLKKKDSVEQPTPSEGSKPRFRTNEIFEGHTILRRIQFLEDTEIYQIRLKDGGLAALKLLRESPKTVLEAFKREALILEKIHSGVAPKLIDCQLEGDTKFLIMEWIDGVQSQVWASRVSQLASQERYSESLRMCTEIVRAYMDLHAQGVLHSDIYPKNVMICRDGTARIVDFGYSFHAEVDAVIGKSRRNCNTYFKSPDLAQRELTDKAEAAPSPSVSSDMYSIGALLYFLVTGSTYVDFALEHTAVHRQICESSMVPFSERGIQGLEGLERIIMKMLAKDPSERYESLEECLDCLKDVELPRAQGPSEIRPLSLDDTPTLKGLAFAHTPSELEAPSASLNFGGAGVAYALLRAAHALDDSSLVQAADVWASHARVWMDRGPGGSLCEKMGITADAIGPYSTLHGGVGVSLVQALVAHSQLDSLGLRGICLEFLGGIHKKEAVLEFVFGKAGMLNTIQQLTCLVEENQPLIRIGNEVVADMMREIASFANLKEAPVQYLGFAHGWAGIFYSLLAWGRKYDPDIVARVTPLLHQLASYKVESRLGSFWPYRFDQPVEAGDMASWCNGTAGFTLLWTEAFLATGDAHWLTLAREAARHCSTYFDGLNSVCCGLAGRGYALAILGSASGEQEWMDAARACLQRAAVGTPDVSRYPHSLFKGVLGHELAKLEVAKGEGIVFPTLASDMYGDPIPVGELE